MKCLYQKLIRKLDHCFSINNKAIDWEVEHQVISFDEEYKDIWYKLGLKDNFSLESKRETEKQTETKRK